jgi:aspartyl-tRNA(Asn)/glutamyl-tRNA(Gln) amidotransferase subunit B
MRCDANVSIRPAGSTEYGTKTEIKNMNSFRSIQRAIESEVARQTEIIESGGKVSQESRLWDEASGTTKLMRSKEEAHDYRYFPDPDLRPLAISRDTVEHLRQTLPELPHQRYERLISGFGLSEADATLLVETKEMGDFFELTVEHTDQYKAVFNWIQGDIAGYLNTTKISLFETRLTPQALAELVHLVEKSTISTAIAKKLLPELLEKGGSPEKLVAEKGLTQVSDEGALRAAIQKVIEANPKETADYKAGKDKLMGFFVGQVMKETKGSANPQMVNQLLKEMLA